MHCWNVIRRGRALRVEVTPRALDLHEEAAIIEAVEREADEGGFDILRITGSVLDSPTDGVASLIRGIGDVAKRHDRRLAVGPI